jgi:hypothetical protein
MAPGGHHSIVSLLRKFSLFSACPENKWFRQSGGDSVMAQDLRLIDKSS